MAERKDHLKNVAFGGNWSEEILITEELRAVLEVIDRAADECGDRDVRNAAFSDAMTYVDRKIEKGPMLCAAMKRALAIENQNLRQAEAKRAAGLIREWLGC